MGCIAGCSALLWLLRFWAAGMDYPLDPGAGAADNRRHADGDRYGGCAAGRPGGALVTGGRVPVLWITGPAGAGKSTVPGSCSPSWRVPGRVSPSPMPTSCVRVIHRRRMIRAVT